MKDLRKMELEDLRNELDVLDQFEARALAVNDSPTVASCQRRRRAVAARIAEILQPKLEFAA